MVGHRIAASRRLQLAGVAVSLAMAVLAACGSGRAAERGSSTSPSSPAGPSTSVDDAPGSPVADTPGSAADPSPGCDAPRTEVDGERRTVAVAELERWYLLTVPASGDDAAPPAVVVDLHGFTEGAEVHARMTGMGAAAHRHGFVAVVPEGTGTPVRWAAGPGGSAASGDRNPDLEFLRTMLDGLERSVCVDRSRVYLVGLSNGAMLASLAACRMADRIAAVAPIAGVTAYDDCAPTATVPMLTVHGTADPILHFNGGVGDLVRLASGGSGPEVAPTTEPAPPADLDGAGYPAATAAWAARNGCSSHRDADVTPTVLRRVYDCPAGSDVEMYVVRDGGHTWPGSELSRSLGDLLGPTTFDVDATELAWEFVSRFRRAS